MDNPIGRRVIENVRLLRTVRGWSARQLAERCQATGMNWNRDIVSNLETGRRTLVTVDEVAALAEVFGVHFYDLVEIDPPAPDHINAVQAVRQIADTLKAGDPA